ncbi:hypothetical protein EUX98_g7539 [Antrodiella citrinella]|uniref:Peptidase A1 domain-containing protein n=1 Tax=Antrodiella citrinella TaxID=2447956 RepID=A0A4S4MLK6_9APHY|nr:hypothetical protein EUX98_g7539 [Antrodiella citrinella]
MLTFPLLSALLGAGVGLQTAHAISIPITKRAAPHSTSVRITPSNNVSGDDPFGFQNIDGFAYSGIIYVSGQPFTVQLDTGSSDLWLDTQNFTLTNLTDTEVVGSISYVDGTGATGDINIGVVTWGDFTVEKQAFINAPGSNATSGGSFNGLLGVGPPSTSDIAVTLNGSQYDGIPFLDNVFALYPDEPNFISFLLSRNEFGITDGGVFTIGDVDSNYTNITSQPQLPVVAPGAWVTYMDGVVVNGNYLFGGSQPGSMVPVPVNQTLVVLDTGTSFATAPPDYVDAMYADIPGAQFDGQSSYIVPCDVRVNVTLVFGNLTYPIHPIDLTSPNSIADDGTFLCQGTFSYNFPGTGLDFILGDAFLRNVYSLYDFGDWASVGTTPPFMQILSTTDIDQANAQFDALNQARIQQAISIYGTPTPSTSIATVTATVASGSASLSTPVIVVTPTPSSINSVLVVTSISTAATVVPSASALASPNAENFAVSGNLADDNSEDIHNLQEFQYIIVGLVGGVLILLIILIVMVAQMMKKGGGMVMGGGGGGRVYKPLHDPTSAPLDHPPFGEHKPYAGYSTPYADEN